MNKRQDKARMLKYKKSILQQLNLYDIQSDLADLVEVADNVTYAWDDDNLLEALDGDEEQVEEFKILMAELSSDCERLSEAIYYSGVDEHFDTFFVSLAMKDRPPQYRMLGYDTVEMDYFAFLNDYEEGIAEGEAIKQLKRLTKDELLRTAGECFRVVLAYLDIREKINALGSVIEIITDENKAILDAVKSIETQYEEAEKINFQPYAKATEALDNTLRLLPDKIWVE